MPEERIRKFITEWTIVVTISARVVGRQQELQRIEIPSGTEPCHLYLVTRAPRASIDPSSVSITDNEFKGILRLQRGPSWDEFPFECPNSLGPGPWRYRAEWPYEEFTVENTEGNIVSKGVVAHLHTWVVGWPAEAIKHDVVYVGQAFGRHGERTAWDRLKRHETVQRILAETSPDKQVWLTLASISDLNVFPEIDPRFPTQKSSAEDDEHIRHVIDAVYNDAFKEKEAVALAEAGLIRYFQPHYNDRMKYAFPAHKQVSLEP